MSNKTARWKNNERQGAESLKEFMLDAERISRASNYSVSTFDIMIKDHPEYKFDAKYSQRGFLVNRMLEVVRDKYCKQKTDFPILLTKGYREVGQKAVVDSRFLFMLLAYWLGAADKQTLEKIYYKG